MLWLHNIYIKFILIYLRLFYNQSLIKMLKLLKIIFKQSGRFINQTLFILNINIMVTHLHNRLH